MNCGNVGEVDAVLAGYQVAGAAAARSRVRKKTAALGRGAPRWDGLLARGVGLGRGWRGGPTTQQGSAHGLELIVLRPFKV